MIFKCTSLFFLSFLFILSNSVAQRQRIIIDSLFEAIQNTKSDTTQIVILQNISAAYLKNKPDSALHFARQAFEKSNQISWDKGLANSMYALGVAYKSIGELDSALKSQEDAVAIFKVLNDTSSLIKVFINTGVIYNSMGNFSMAIENCLNALRLAESRHDSVSMSKAYLNIGLTYYHEKQYEKALNNYDKALEIQEFLQDKNSIGAIRTNQGLIYNRQNKVELALSHYFKALENFKAVENKANIATTLSNIGTLYMEKRNYTASLKHQWDALAMFQSMKDKTGVGRSYHNLGHSYFLITNDSLTNALPDSLKNKKILLNKAASLLQNAIEIKLQTNELNSLQNSYVSLSDVYEKAGRVSEALYYYRQHVIYKDSVFNMESKEKIANLEAKRENQLKEKEIQIQKLELTVLEKQRVYYIGIIFFIFLLATILLYRYKLKQTLNLVKLRTRIADDLHDDISSTLSSISISSSIIQKKMGNTETEVNSLLNQISTNTDSVMEAMNDIVWTINTENDRFDNVVNRMRAFAIEVLEAKNCNVHFEVSENLRNVSMNMEQRKNLYLIFKEAIHNISKYALCKNVWVTLKSTGNKITMVVKDDGVGFEKEFIQNGHKKGGNGLVSIRKRALELQGQINIDSSPNSGTSLVLEFTPKNSL